LSGGKDAAYGLGREHDVKALLPTVSALLFSVAILVTGNGLQMDIDTSQGKPSDFRSD
jgi:hypothetical protein